MLRCLIGCSAMTVPLLPPPSIQPLIAMSCTSSLKGPSASPTCHRLPHPYNFCVCHYFPSNSLCFIHSHFRDILNLSSSKMYCHCSTSASIRLGSGKDHPEVLFCEQWTSYDNCGSDQISPQDSYAASQLFSWLFSHILILTMASLPLVS